ncbi:ribonuclease H protein, partial [Trifolium medium]|nr:ribonuclease H protein [Trifolium medium]
MVSSLTISTLPSGVGLKIKCNTDGNSKGNPGIAACSGIFRNYKGEVIGCFVQYLGIANALFAEVMGVILAI